VFFFAALLVLVVVLTGVLAAGLDQVWYDGVLVVTATVGFFTALLVRQRYSGWWWLAIGSAMLTLSMLIAQFNGQFVAAVWGSAAT